MKISKIMMLGLMICIQSFALRIENQTMKPFTATSIVEKPVLKLINGNAVPDTEQVSIDTREIKPGQAIEMTESTEGKNWFSILESGSTNYINIQKLKMPLGSVWSGETSDVFSAQCDSQGCVVSKPRR